MKLTKTMAWLLAALMMLSVFPAALAEEGVVETVVEETGEAAAEVAEETVVEEAVETVPTETVVKEEAQQPAAVEKKEEAQLPAVTETAQTAANTSAESLAAADSQRLDAAYTLALNAITSEDYETAKEYINICFAYCDAQSNPAIFSDLLLKRACIDVIEEKNDMALLNLDAALRVQPDLADAYLVRTQVYATEGNVDQAIENLEKYIELTGDATLYETVAQLQEAKGDIAAAQAAYDKFVEGAGASVEEAGFQSGLYKMESGDYEGAIAAFKAYADNETFGAGAMYNIGVCKMNSGDYAGAVDAFNQCEEKGGAFEGLYYNRGVCSLLAQNWTAASKDFTTSIEKEPYTADARYNLGICQMQTEDYEGAVATFTEYIDSLTEGATVNYGAYYYRAVCRGALGQTEDALADFTVCIDNQYELAQAYYQRAQIYAAMGDTEKQNADLAESLKYSN